METVIELLREVHPDVDYEGCETLIDDGIFDSFDIVSVISEISSRLDLVIPGHEIIPENFNSARALYRLIQRLEEEA